MHKQNYLRGALICLSLIIIFETGNFPSRLIAQLEQTYQELKLAQGNVSYTIPEGDWIVCQLDNLSQHEPVFAGGILLGTMDQTLVIQDYKTEEIFSFPINSISMIYHGEAKRKLFYTWKWAKRGMFAGLAWGAMWTTFAVAAAVEEGDWTYVPFIAFISTGCGEAGGVPLGALIGFIQGLIKEGNAMQYILDGENPWQIVI